MSAIGINLVIVTDSREQTPLVFTRFPTITAGLVTGDYSVRGLEDHFAIERKSIADLVGSVIQGRELIYSPASK